MNVSCLAILCTVLFKKNAWSRLAQVRLSSLTTVNLAKHWAVLTQSSSAY
ncbi:MAG: hypothetical protein ACQESR_12210 [Planctomycetota bacterium]